MEKTETLEAFYREKFNQKSEDLSADQLQFNILSHQDCLSGANMLYRRRDFYKVSFVKGRNIIHYGDKSLKAKGPALVFFNPDVPYTVEMLEEQKEGHYFIFRESYFNDYYRSNIRDLPIFAKGIKPVYILNKSQEKLWLQFSRKCIQK